MKNELFNKINGFILLIVLLFLGLINIIIMTQGTSGNYLKGYGVYIILFLLFISCLLGIITSVYLNKMK